MTDNLVLSNELPAPLPCPFCGYKLSLDNPTTLHPDGTGWKSQGDMRAYCSFREVPKEQWCYVVNCDETTGGCGANIHGDSTVETVEKWNQRV